jgi:hypothetical protein
MPAKRDVAGDPDRPPLGRRERRPVQDENDMAGDDGGDWRAG